MLAGTLMSNDRGNTAVVDADGLSQINEGNTVDA